MSILSDVHPTLRELIELGRKRKWISYEELNTTLPDEMVDPEKLDELLTTIENLGIDLINEEAVRRRGYQSFQAPLQTNLKFKRDDPNREAVAPNPWRCNGWSGAVSDWSSGTSSAGAASWT